MGAAGTTWPPFFYAIASGTGSAHDGARRRPVEARREAISARVGLPLPRRIRGHGGQQKFRRTRMSWAVRPRSDREGSAPSLRPEDSVEGANSARRLQGGVRSWSPARHDMTDGRTRTPRSPFRRRRLEKIQVLRTADKSRAPPQEACSGPLGADLATDCPVGPPQWALRRRMAEEPPQTSETTKSGSLPRDMTDGRSQTLKGAQLRLSKK